MEGYEEMFRAFGWNQHDEIVHYDRARRTYEAAQGDFGTCFSARGVFSVGVEKRWVLKDSVNFVEVEAALEAAAPAPKKASSAAKAAAKD